MSHRQKSHQTESLSSQALFSSKKPEESWGFWIAGVLNASQYEPLRIVAQLLSALPGRQEDGLLLTAKEREHSIQMACATVAAKTFRSFFHERQELRSVIRQLFQSSKPKEKEILLSMERPLLEFEDGECLYLLAQKLLTLPHAFASSWMSLLADDVLFFEGENPLVSPRLLFIQALSEAFSLLFFSLLMEEPQLGLAVEMKHLWRQGEGRTSHLAKEGLLYELSLALGENEEGGEGGGSPQSEEGQYEEGQCEEGQWQVLMVAILRQIAIQDGVETLWKKILLKKLYQVRFSYAEVMEGLLGHRKSSSPPFSPDGALGKEVLGKCFHELVRRYDFPQESSLSKLIGVLIKDLKLSEKALSVFGLLFFWESDLLFSRLLSRVTLERAKEGLSLEVLELIFSPEPQFEDLVGILEGFVALGLVAYHANEGRTLAHSERYSALSREAEKALLAKSFSGSLKGLNPHSRFYLSEDALEIALGRPMSQDALSFAPLTLVSPAAFHSAIGSERQLQAFIQEALHEAVQLEKMPLIVLTGPPGFCRSGLLEDALQDLRSPFKRVLSLDFSGLSKARFPHLSLQSKLSMAKALLQTLSCQAVLRRATPLLLFQDLDLEREAFQEAFAALIAESLLSLKRPVFCASRFVVPGFFKACPLLEIKVQEISLIERARLLAFTTPSHVLFSDLPALEQTLRGTPASPQVLYQSLLASLALYPAKPGPNEVLTLPSSFFAKELRHAMSQRLGDFAHRVETPLGKEVLQLPEKEREAFHELLGSVRQRHKVMHEWGFYRADQKGQGFVALFYGPPGTGKTMAAGVLARELGLEMFRVDLSRVVDKYVGETEKALGRVFDEAERGQVLLLFDEADSLFGKRVEASSSSDQHANLAVNYLLQRIESYQGVVVLTTNFESHLDPAFKRRIRYQIHFPLPEASERAAIWRSLIPEEAPLSKDVDFQVLGERFELSGGHIKSAVLNGAIQALIDEKAISMSHLWEGGKREYRSLGRVLREPRAQGKGV